MQRHPHERDDGTRGDACRALAGFDWHGGPTPRDYGEWRDAARCDPALPRDLQRHAGAMHRGYAGAQRGEMPQLASDFRPPPREGRFAGRGSSDARARGFAGVGPRGYRRSDLRVREAVHEALRDAGDVDATDVEVEVVQGEVTLSGTVPTRAMKRAAELSVENLPGVGDVINRVRVESGRAGEPDEVLDARGVRFLRP